MAKQAAGHRGNVAPITDVPDIEKLMAGLVGKDGLERVRARKALVLLGEPAVPYLVHALEARREWVRWEAAKTLSLIGCPSATEALITALEDKMFDVRWLSAEGLIAIGRDALVPLLHALIDRAESPWFREGAHRFLHGITDKDLEPVVAPVIAALEGDTALDVPLAAEQALDALGHGGVHQ